MKNIQKKIAALFLILNCLALPVEKKDKIDSPKIDAPIKTQDIHQQAKKDNLESRINSHKQIDQDYEKAKEEIHKKFNNTSKKSNKKRNNNHYKDLKNYHQANFKIWLDLKNELKASNLNSKDLEEMNKAVLNPVNEFIEKAHESDLKYNDTLNQIHEQYTKSVGQAVEQRDQYQDKVRTEAVDKIIINLDNLFKKIKDDNCSIVPDKAIKNFATKRKANLQKFLTKENESRQALKKTKQQAHKEYTAEISKARIDKSLKNLKALKEEREKEAKTIITQLSNN